MQSPSEIESNWEAIVGATEFVEHEHVNPRSCRIADAPLQRAGQKRISADIWRGPRRGDTLNRRVIPSI
jgi:hypothetical protein